MSKINKDTKLTYNSKYILKDEKPWFPIMGEIHYSRYPKEYWKESIYKMKAGGIDIISSYIIWIHHEEIEGEYNFEGNSDLREFIQTAKECDASIFLRIGPWCHGEVRNGGFPDWLLEKDFTPRSNDEKYLEEVSKYFKRLYQEVDGYLLKDGGPVVGLQIENEYGHAGGMDGEEGEEHMRILTRLAKEAGFDLPLYTATGWGGAVTGGLLPVMGGYCEAPWDKRITEIPPSGNFVFTEERNDHNIGSDYGFGAGITYDLDKFPYLTAELGGGIQVTRHRRPIAKAEDIGAISMVKLGSGINLLGYYMYHGGTNPKGKLTTLQESKATGAPNDLPEFSYDFNAPIKEYGQLSQTYKEVKLYAMFAKDFGPELCDMEVEIPESNPLTPTNFTDLRSSVRRNGKQGYLFVSNYQRRKKMADHLNEKLRVELEDEVIEYPSIDIHNGDYFFLPFNMPVGEVSPTGETTALLRSGLASPLCKIESNDNETSYVFYTDVDPQYDIEGSMGKNSIITISREDAKNAWKYKIDGRDYLFVGNSADTSFIQEGEKVVLLDNNVVGTDRKLSFKTYPELNSLPEHFKLIGNEDDLFVYELDQASLSKDQDISVNFRLTKEDQTEANPEKIEQKPDKYNEYEVNVNYNELPDYVSDLFLDIKYRGESGQLFINGDQEGDSFYTGQTWQVGLKRFDFAKDMTIKIFELKKDLAIYLEEWPEMEAGKDSAMIIDDIKIIEEIRLEII